MKKKVMPVLAIHGGAILDMEEDFISGHDKEYYAALHASLDVGYAVLEKKGTAIDAIVSAIKVLEDCPLFDAGKGSVLKRNGRIQMDASIMEGRFLKAGAVASVERVKNPIAAAKLIMDSSDHVLLSGKGADEYCSLYGMDMEPQSYFRTKFQVNTYRRYKSIEKNSDIFSKKHESGTVGAVARDMYGDLAAGTSTGGLAYGHFGRIGDSPLIGLGTYANNRTCAVSATGWGELFMKGVVAYDISAMMEYTGCSLQYAVREVIIKKQKFFSPDGNTGGAIALDAQGNIALVYNSLGMCRGSIDQYGKREVGIFSL